MKRILLICFFSFAYNVFAQTPGSGVTDADGNTYPTLIFGPQEVMKENLRTTTYCNGDPIPNITDGTQWENLTTGAWAYYDNDASRNLPYGKLYNWFVVANAANVCPCGWHVPSEEEWDELRSFIGLPGVGGNVGGKMKETGLTHWKSPNYGATNETNFTAVGSGGRYLFGDFANLRDFADYWTSTEYDDTNAFKRDLGAGHNVFSGSTTLTKRFGIAIRCMKDIPLSTSKSIKKSTFLYPNPTSGVVTLAIAEQHLPASFKITDLSGKTLYEGQVTASQASFNLAHLQSGVYFATISSGRESAYIKLIKN